MASIRGSLRRAVSYAYGFDPEFIFYLFLGMVGALLAFGWIRISPPYEFIGLCLGFVLFIAGPGLIIFNLERKNRANQWTENMSVFLRASHGWSKPTILDLQKFVNTVCCRQMIVPPKVKISGKNASSSDIANAIIHIGNLHVDEIYVLHELSHIFIAPRQGHASQYHRAFMRLLVSSGILSPAQIQKCAEDAKVHMPYLE